MTCMNQRWPFWYLQALGGVKNYNTTSAFATQQEHDCNFPTTGLLLLSFVCLPFFSTAHVVWGKYAAVCVSALIPRVDAPCSCVKLNFCYHFHFCKDRKRITAGQKKSYSLWLYCGNFRNKICCFGQGGPYFTLFYSFPHYWGQWGPNC